MNLRRAFAAAVLAALPLAGCAGSQPETGQATGHQPVMGQATGPQPATGQATAPQPVTGQATAPQPVTAQATGPQPVTGRVTGQLMSVGSGPSNKRPMAGIVTFVAAGKQSMAVRADASGNFSAQLPQGRYQVSGPCPQSFPVTVTVNQTTHLNVYCVIAVGSPPAA